MDKHSNNSSRMERPAGNKDQKHQQPASTKRSPNQGTPATPSIDKTTKKHNERDRHK